MRNPTAATALILAALTSLAAGFTAVPECSRKLSLTQLCSSNAEDFSRRNFLTTGLVASSAILLPGQHVLADEGFVTFADEACGFKISVPAAWEKSEQVLSDRRRIVLFIEPGSSGPGDQTLAFAAFTPVRDDYTSLSSFGGVDQVARATILPKGEIQGEKTESTLISAESKKNAYFFDYKVRLPEKPEIHYRAIFTLAAQGTGGAGQVLVTLTAQTPESKYEEKKATFDKIIDSFGRLQ